MGLFNCLFKCELIMNPRGEEYLTRWVVIPKNRFFNIYLHRFSGSDLRYFHDHPWHSLSIVLCGSYVEYVPGRCFRRRRGNVVFRKSTYLHYIEVGKGEICWTLFLTGWVHRKWGFIVVDRWIPWKEFEKCSLNNLLRGPR